MDEAFIKRLEDSFALLAPAADQLVDVFYGKLFAENPSVRPMFPEVMDEQKKKLVASLVLVVNNLRKPEVLAPALQELGGRHQDMGAEEEHYAVVRDTMLSSMAEVAGDIWTEELEADWKAALDFVASVMLQGYKKPVGA